MKVLRFGALAALGVLVGCTTEREEVREAAQEVREERGETREEVGREVQEGREEVAEARRNLAEELRQLERRGEVVEFDAVVTGRDQDSLLLRLPDGGTFEVDYGPESRFFRGGETVGIEEFVNGQAVRVRYRIVEARRMLDEARVTEGELREPALPPTDGMEAPGTGGTQ